MQKIYGKIKYSNLENLIAAKQNVVPVKIFEKNGFIIFIQINIH